MKFTKLVDVADTRWLSVDLAVQSVWKNLLRIICDLRDVTERGGTVDATAIGLYSLVRSAWFINCLALFMDVMPQFTMLFKLFQQRDVDLGAVCSMIPAVRASVEAMIDGPSPSSFESKIQATFEFLKKHDIEIVAQRHKRDVRSA